MTIFKRGLILFCAALLVLAACRKDEEEVAVYVSRQVVQSSIIGVNGPTSGKAGEELTFDLLWHSADSAQRFHHLTDSALENSRIIRLYTKAPSLDSLKADTTAATTQYKFKAVSPGTYFLKFYSDDTGKDAIVDTVTIQ